MGSCYPILQMRMSQLTGAEPSSLHAWEKRGHREYLHLTHGEMELQRNSQKQLKDFPLFRKERQGRPDDLLIRPFLPWAGSVVPCQHTRAKDRAPTLGHPIQLDQQP